MSPSRKFLLIHLPSNEVWKWTLWTKWASHDGHTAIEMYKKLAPLPPQPEPRCTKHYTTHVCTAFPEEKNDPTLKICHWCSNCRSSATCARSQRTIILMLGGGKKERTYSSPEGDVESCQKIPYVQFSDDSSTSECNLRSNTVSLSSSPFSPVLPRSSCAS